MVQGYDAIVVGARCGGSPTAELREAFTVEEILVEDGHVTGIRGHAKGPVGRPQSRRSR